MAIPFNDNIQNNSPKSLDNKYLSNGITPWSSTAAAIAGIPIAYRSAGLKILVNVGGENVEFWWRDGTADNQLIPVNLDKFTLTGDGTRDAVSGSFLKRILIKPSSSLAALKVGTTVGGDEILPEMEVSSGAWFNITVERFIDSSTIIYFTGITSSSDIRFYYE